MLDYDAHIHVFQVDLTEQSSRDRINLVKGALASVRPRPCGVGADAQQAGHPVERMAGRGSRAPFLHGQAGCLR